MVFHRSIAQLEGVRWGQSAMGISVFCYIRKLFGVVLFQGSMLDLEEGDWGQSAICIYAYCFI